MSLYATRTDTENVLYDSISEFSLVKMFGGLLPYKASNGIYISKAGTATLKVPYGLISLDTRIADWNVEPHKFDLWFIYHPRYSDEYKYMASCRIGVPNEESLERLSVVLKETDDKYSKALLRKGC